MSIIINGNGHNSNITLYKIHQVQYFCSLYEETVWTITANIFIFLLRLFIKQMIIRDLFLNSSLFS